MKVTKVAKAFWTLSSAYNFLQTYCHALQTYFAISYLEKIDCSIITLNSLENVIISLKQ